MSRRIRPTIVLQAINALLLLAILIVQIDIRQHMPPTIGELRGAKGRNLQAIQSRMTRQFAEVEGSVAIDNVSPVPVEIERGDESLRVRVDGSVEVTASEPLVVTIDR